jgi:hypothetical protein
MNPTLRRTIAAAAVTLVLAAAACGDDDETSASDDEVADAVSSDSDSDSADGTDVAAYCEASLAIETAPEPEIDFATATEAEIGAAMQTFVTDVMRPLVDDALPLVPAEIEGDVDTMVAAIDQTAETGDPSGFESPEFAEAEGRVHAYDREHCGWETLDVVATEYRYDGVPAELPAGPTSFEFSNEGQELHELGLVRVNDGVTETLHELLALPEDEVMAKVTFQGSPTFAPPGTGGYKVVDLEPGRYVIGCFVPTGMTSQDGPPPDPSAPPHAVHGMITEFTVA